MGIKKPGKPIVLKYYCKQYIFGINEH